MKAKNLFAILSSLALTATLLLATACGESSSTATDPGQISTLEAKARTGDTEAAYELAEMLAADTGNSANQVKALTWFHIAAKGGKQEAGLAIKMLEKSLTGEQIMEATLAADQFKATDGQTP